MKIGYIRVSTQKQNTIRQEVIMQELGAVDELYIDKASGKLCVLVSQVQYIEQAVHQIGALPVLFT